MRRSEIIDAYIPPAVVKFGEQMDTGTTRVDSNRKLSLVTWTGFVSAAQNYTFEDGPDIDFRPIAYNVPVTTELELSSRYILPNVIRPCEMFLESANRRVHAHQRMDGGVQPDYSLCCTENGTERRLAFIES